MINAVPLALATCTSACAQARTWETVPGADSSASDHMVWIESMTTASAAGACSSVATMSARLVAAASSTGDFSSPSRRARMRTWAMASSPEM